MSVWDTGRLLLACYVLNPERLVRGPKAWQAMASAVREVYPLGLDELLVEGMQYDGRMSRGSPADVFEVEGVVRKIMEVFSGGRVRSVTPKEWAGNTPKEVRFERVQRALTPEEWANIEPPARASLMHNVLDSVALGFWHVKRTGQREPRFAGPRPVWLGPTFPV